MIGKAPVLVNRHRMRRDRNAWGRDLVVDAPTDVLCPRLAAVRPPGVMSGLLIDAAENVDEAQFVEDPRQPGPLLGQEAGVLLVAAPVLEIDRLMRDVPVAAENDLALLPAQLEQMRQELLKEAELRRLPMRACGSRRQVDAGDGELAEIGFEIAAFAVEFGGAETGGYLGLRLGVERDTRVTLARGGQEEAVRLAWCQQRTRNLIRTGLDLLQAHHIPGLDAREPSRQPLALGRADAVDVERDDAHEAGAARSAEFTGKIRLVSPSRR